MQQDVAENEKTLEANAHEAMKKPRKGCDKMQNGNSINNGRRKHGKTSLLPEFKRTIQVRCSEDFHCAVIKSAKVNGFRSVPEYVLHLLSNEVKEAEKSGKLLPKEQQPFA